MNLFSISTLKSDIQILFFVTIISISFACQKKDQLNINNIRSCSVAHLLNSTSFQNLTPESKVKLKSIYQKCIVELEKYNIKAHHLKLIDNIPRPAAFLVPNFIQKWLPKFFYDNFVLHHVLFNKLEILSIKFILYALDEKKQEARRILIELEKISNRILNLDHSNNSQFNHIQRTNTILKKLKNHPILK